MPPSSFRPVRLLPTRIRSKLIFLHTTFSLGLALLLLLVMRPPLRDMLSESEMAEARLALELDRAAPGVLERTPMEEVSLRIGTAEQIGLDAVTARAARDAGGAVIETDGRSRRAGDPPVAVRWDDARQAFVAASVRHDEAREAMNRLYLLLTIALLAVYGLIAITLEVFVLPRQVYDPIETLRAADEAVQQGRREDEVIPDDRIPPGELGDIMRSRNQSIVKLRDQEEALERALQQIEAAANELQRKNHLLETARRNLADQDRLASLGMMSAGIAHELNTPLAVLKGCVEELVASREQRLTAERTSLMLRTVRRLERLSEGLLDFARVKPIKREPVRPRDVILEAWTLVSLDRRAADVDVRIDVPPSLDVQGDADRLVQVFVNLLRNAVDAMDASFTPKHIEIRADESERDGRRWVSITVADSGPGIDPEVLPRLFEPFRSTKLDSHGTGLGLAVADGIIRDHGGILLARNLPADSSVAGVHGGAVFEIMLPADDRLVPYRPPALVAEEE